MHCILYFKKLQELFPIKSSQCSFNSKEPHFYPDSEIYSKPCLLSGARDWFVKYFTERGQNIPLYVLSFHRVIFQKFTKHDIFNTDTRRFIQPEVSEAFYISDSIPLIKGFLAFQWTKVQTDHWKAYLRFKLKCQIVKTLERMEYWIVIQ